MPERYRDSCHSHSKYVPISETIRGFREILDGKMDDVPESYFLNAGSIDEVRARMG